MKFSMFTTSQPRSSSHRVCVGTHSILPDQLLFISREPSRLIPKRTFEQDRLAIHHKFVPLDTDESRHCTKFFTVYDFDELSVTPRVETWNAAKDNKTEHCIPQRDLRLITGPINLPSDLNLNKTSSPCFRWKSSKNSPLDSTKSHMERCSRCRKGRGSVGL